MSKQKMTRVQLNHDPVRHHPVLKLFGLSSILLLLVGGVGYVHLKDNTPAVSKSQLMSHQGHYSTLYASNGQIIWGQNHNKELNASRKQINYHLRPALLSIEDRDFYKEHGINFIRTVKAVGTDLWHRNKSQGGSTLTEQLVKNSFFPASTTAKKSIDEKVKEIMLAKKVNHKYSKNQILKMYVNKVYMGSGIYGMETASYFYFGKPMNKISVTQAALLAGIVQSPTNYDPYLHPKYALLRRNTVLRAMADNHKISHKKARRLIKEPISKDIIPFSTKRKIAEKNYQTRLISDDYTQAALAQLRKKHYNLSESSYRVKTPLNMNVQRKLYHIVNDKNNVPWPSKHLNVAVSVINNQNGKDIAQIGGRGKRPLGAYDQAMMSDRSTGSAIKPILDYAPALDDLGWSTGHIIYDEKYKYPGTNNNVYDWDDRYQGKLTLSRALMNSRNIPAIKTLARVGLNRANRLASLAGIGQQKYYANAIGTNTSAAHLASAYSALANYGVRDPLSFLDKIGKSGALKSVKDKPKQVMSPQTAYMLTKVLENIPTKHELGQDAIIHGLNQAGKTGTVGYANGNAGHSKNAISDAWYVGYTKQFTIAIWTGYNNPKHEMMQKDANVSEIIYKDLMQYLMKLPHINKSTWSRTSGITTFHSGGLKQYAFKDANKIVSPSLKDK